MDSTHEMIIQCKKDIYDLKQIIRYMLKQKAELLTEADKMIVENTLKRLNIK